MLRSLLIKNYALITELNISFERGFSVITGETGAGKSILLGAIGLLLGQRAESRMIKEGERRCIIEAEFDLSGYGMEDFFERYELDFDGQLCTLRRELTDTGKSRAFINDTPAQVALLRELGDRLIDIHSQHQNLLLAQEDFQLSVVDIIARNAEARKVYEEAFREWQRIKQELRHAEEAVQRGREDEDYMRFQLLQLDDLQLAAGMQADCEQEQQQLEHAEDIRGALYQTEQCLAGDSTSGEGLIAQLHDAGRQLSAISGLMPAVDELAERLKSVEIELNDIQDELSRHAERVEVNPERLQAVSEWLSQLYALQQKHHVQSEDELLQLRDSFRKRLEAIDHGDEHIEALRQELTAAFKKVTETGQTLTNLRKKAAGEVEQQMCQRLMTLGIPNVKFEVAVTPRTEPTPSGLDQIEFRFSANKNGHPEPIAQIASGGEIARVMLSLKAMISGAVSLPTIIFDEIDTGVSGQIAERMAHIMREMGDGGRQVISITHLPQIAAFAQHHYRVYKEDDDHGTTSHLVRLSADERVTELAHLLSGAHMTDAAIENARALLANASSN